MSEAPKRAKKGYIKEVVWFAKMNDLSAWDVSRRFLVNMSSVYRAATRMGVQLKHHRNFSKPRTRSPL